MTDSPYGQVADMLSTRIRSGSAHEHDRVVHHAGATLSLHGEFDYADRDRLARAVACFADRCIDAPPADGALIEASDLRFLDAASLGALVALPGRLAEAGIRLRTRGASSTLRRLIETCDLDGVFGLEPVSGGGRS